MTPADRLAQLARALAERMDGPSPGPPVVEYLGLLERWGSKLRLTGARTPEALVEIALADAFVLSGEALVPPGSRLVDVGAGAGAPAIPLLLLRSDLRASLVEPLQKRAAFLRTAIGTLGLPDRVQIHAVRADAIADRFDLAMSRATFAPPEWLAIGRGLAREVIVLSSGEKPPPLEGQRLIAEREYRLPSGAARWVGRYG